MNDMTDVNLMLADAASRLFADVCTREALDAAESGQWPDAIWRAAEDLGLTMAIGGEAPEDALGLDALAVIAHSAGTHAVPLPLVEGFLAQRLLAVAGLPVPSRRATVAMGCGHAMLRLNREGDRLSVSGELRRVPWGRHVDYIAARVQEGDTVSVVRLDGLNPARLATNLAGEPRDDFVLAGHAVAADAIAPLPPEVDFEGVLFEGALLRCLQMTGALERILRQTIRYSTERVQFGRPIAKFQAIQQQVAELATHVAAALAATDAALLAACAGPARFQIAAAKARTGEAAGAAVAIAHQVHGAMGFTHEHPLHLSTRRLLSWRDEYGSEVEWSMWTGRLLRRIGGDDLWPFITQPRDFADLQRQTEVQVGIV